jgi:hypothetical protein
MKHGGEEKVFETRQIINSFPRNIKASSQAFPARNGIYGEMDSSMLEM